MSEATGASNPDVMVIRRAVRSALIDLAPGTNILVACSGGADSLALADATVFEGARAGWVVDAVVIDHALQPDSPAVAVRAAKQCEAIGYRSVEVVTVQVGTSGGTEAAARDARYAALEHCARETDATVLLGHTLDDQAETVLLGLGRGSGTRSLSGMPSVTGRFRRPLLGVHRSQTRAACSARGLTVWDDPHNDDPAFARVRVRHHALPALEAALGPGVAEALARTATSARTDADALDALAAKLYADVVDEQGDLDVTVLAHSLAAVRRRVLRRAALKAGCPGSDLGAVHVDELDRLVTDWHGQGPLTLPGGVLATRSRGWIRLTPAVVGR